MTTLDDALSVQPIIAILRGIQPNEAAATALALYDEGFRCIEVPLNSPEPFESIKLMTEAVSEECITGAGTVTDPADVARVREAGGRVIVTPNTNPDVIRAAVDQGLFVVPGVGTATEAFTAVGAGAKHLKLFPASTFGTGHLKALSSVLPKGTQFVATGGVGAKNITEWSSAGASGFGIGGELYKPGDTVETVISNARQILAMVSANS